MSNNIHRDGNHTFGTFRSYLQLGLRKNIQPHDKNRIEKIGDTVLWLIEGFPRVVRNKLTEPKVLTVGITLFSLYINTLIFYFSKTMSLTLRFFRWFPVPPFWAVRFGAYSFTSLLIIGFALRAYGRFSNEPLMRQFEEPQPQGPAV